MEKYTVKERFAYLPCLVWDVPAINGRYYRFIWWKKFYTIQKNNKWMIVHTYADKFTADQRRLNFNAGYKYKYGSFS
jgi:hypothetical protein